MKPPLTKPDYFEEKMAGTTDRELYKKYNLNPQNLALKKSRWGFKDYNRESFSKLKKVIKFDQEHFKGRRYGR